MIPDIKSIVSQLQLEEKAALTVGMNRWKTVPVERLGIPSIAMSDGPHGVRKAEELADTSLPATCFPTASALAATWNVDLVHELGQALADECIAQDVDVVLGPGNNMKRTPLCGRNFEYFSEDPYLGGEMAAAYIQGVQSKGVGTSLKHFAANNQETNRMTVDARVDERTLYEIYLTGFERAVKKGKPWTVMCSYNRLNGEHASQNKNLLTSILKERWGYEGFVVSDWGAVHNRVASLAAGLDLEMPGPQSRRVQQVIEAVKSGELDEAVLDAAVERLLRIIFLAAKTPKGGTAIDINAHHALARKIAAEAIVLLKNDGGLLPLRDVTKVAVIGTSAKEPYFQGGGSSHINPTRVDVPLDELQKLMGETELAYAPGYPMVEGFNQAMIDEAVQTASQAQVALLYIALPPFKESEGYDRADLELTEQQVALIQAVAAVQPRCVVILNNGSAVDMRAWIERVPAVLEAWMMGQAGGGAIADVLTGKVNPSGKLSETFPYKLSDTPAYINFPGEAGQVRYGEGVYIGYRYYDAREMTVLFPFGHGLSYTSFELSNLRISKEKIGGGEGVTVQVDVRNTGPAAGQAVIQVYVHDRQSSVSRPPKELKGFVKTALPAGGARTVSIELDDRSFAYYHPGAQDWVWEAGDFEVLVGQSAAGPFLSGIVKLEAENVPLPLTMDSTLAEWFSHPTGANVLMTYVQELFSQTQAEAGGGDQLSALMEHINWVKDLPLETALAFWGDNLPTTPEAVVRKLLSELEG